MTLLLRAIESCCVAMLSLSAVADNHADAPKALPMALWSTYEIPAGAKPSEIEASLKEYLLGEEKRGPEQCAFCRHLVCHLV